MTLRSRSLPLVLLVLLAVGGPLTVSGASPGPWTLPVVEYHTFPFTFMAGEPDKCQHTYWSKNWSPTTPDAPRKAEPARYLPVSGEGGKPEWWIAFDLYVPSTYPAVGRPDGGGAIVNFHNVAHDVGWGSERAGISPILINLASTGPGGFNVSLPANDSQLTLPRPKLNGWTSVLVHVVFGLSQRVRQQWFPNGFEGVPVPSGLLEVWVNGRGPFRVTDANLLNWIPKRHKDSRLQKWVQVWQGGPYAGKGYPCDASANAPANGWVEAQTAARFGSGPYPDGPKAALADRPILKGALDLASGGKTPDVASSVMPGYESRIPLVPPNAIGFGQKAARRSYAVRLPRRDPAAFVLPKAFAGLR